MATTENSGPRTLGKVRPHPSQNEALLFEKSSPGKRAFKLPPLDVPAVNAEALLGSAVAHESCGTAGALRDRADPPLHAALHLELRDRPRHVPAGLVHHEVQPARERVCRPHRGAGRGASLPARRARAGYFRGFGSAAALPAGDHRHGRDYVAARGWRARRVHGNSAHAGMARVAGQSAQERFSFPTRPTAPIRPPRP